MYILYNYKIVDNQKEHVVLMIAIKVLIKRQIIKIVLDLKMFMPYI
jgi:hypothetical protein